MLKVIMLIGGMLILAVIVLMLYACIAIGAKADQKLAELHKILGDLESLGSR